MKSDFSICRRAGRGTSGEKTHFSADNKWMNKRGDTVREEKKFSWVSIGWREQYEPCLRLRLRPGATERARPVVLRPCGPVAPWPRSYAEGTSFFGLHHFLRKLFRIQSRNQSVSARRVFISFIRLIYLILHGYFVLCVWEEHSRNVPCHHILFWIPVRLLIIL